MSAARSNGPKRYYADHLRAEAARLRSLARDFEGDDATARLAAEALEAAAAELERAADQLDPHGTNA
jgi:hypothetical protein